MMNETDSKFLHEIYQEIEKNNSTQELQIFFETGYIPRIEATAKRS